MEHEFGPVDDCIRCIHCEALVGSPGPCSAAPAPAPDRMAPVMPDVPKGRLSDLREYVAQEIEYADDMGIDFVVDPVALEGMARLLRWAQAFDTLPGDLEVLIPTHLISGEEWREWMEEDEV